MLASVSSMLSAALWAKCALSVSVLVSTLSDVAVLVVLDEQRVP